MRDFDKIERILIILIMVIEMFIIYRALTISAMLGVGFALFFPGLDMVIMHIHRKYFRDNGKEKNRDER